MILDGLQGSDLIESRHYDHRAAERLDGTAKSNRRGVIERRRRQIHGVFIEAPQRLLQGSDKTRVFVDLVIRQRPADTLRASGRARAVQHETAGRFVGEIVAGVLGNRSFVRVVAVLDPVYHQPGMTVRRKTGQRFGNLAQVF